MIQCWLTEIFFNLSTFNAVYSLVVLQTSCHLQISVAAPLKVYAKYPSILQQDYASLSFPLFSSLCAHPLLSGSTSMPQVKCLQISLFRFTQTLPKKKTKKKTQRKKKYAPNFVLARKYFHFFNFMQIFFFKINVCAKKGNISWPRRKLRNKLNTAE